MNRGLVFFLICSVLSVVSLTCVGCAEKSFSRGEPGAISLAWNPNKEPDLAGYKVYYGTVSRRYGPGIDVGNVTSYSLSGLLKGQKYYVSVTAYNKSGKESSFSKEVNGLPK
jgi:fibronectin type 3 domain-containing protein